LEEWAVSGMAATDFKTGLVPKKKKK